MQTNRPEKILLLRVCADETFKEALIRLRRQNPSAEFTLLIQESAKKKWEDSAEATLLTYPSLWEYAFPLNREMIRLVRRGGYDRAVLPVEGLSGRARQAKLLLLLSKIPRCEIWLPQCGWRTLRLSPASILGRLAVRWLKTLLQPTRLAHTMTWALLGWMAYLAVKTSFLAVCLFDRLLRLEKPASAEKAERLRRRFAWEMSRLGFEHSAASGLVSVVIPNWNGRHLLDACLRSLQSQTYRPLEIIVVDNGSTDGSVECLRSGFPEVQVIALSRNLGFAPAVNRGIAASRGEFICLVNNDTEADSRFIEEQVKALQEDSFAGSAASKILWFHRRGLIQSAGDRYWAGGEVYWAGENQLDSGEYDQPGYVFSACGAGAMYRREFLEKAGFFDESFGSYCEDVDLGFRGNLLGFGCRYVPSARLYHGVAKTGGRSSLWACQTGRNELTLLLRNMPSVMLRENCGLIVRVQRERIRAFNNTPYGRAFSQGKLAVLMRLPRILRQRALLQRTRLTDLSHLEGSIDTEKSAAHLRR